MWDDYRPVQYAQKTVEVSTMLSLFNGLPFEVQVSQSFNDGNPDFAWARGAVITSPEKGLWDPCGQVTEEDVRHMRNRFVPFRCHAVVARLADSNPCAAHLCKWLVDGAATADARAALRPAFLHVYSRSQRFQPAAAEQPLLIAYMSERI